METALKAIGASVLVVCLLSFFMFIGAMFGYFAGWLFGEIFSQTWDVIHLWLNMPPQLNPGMFGAFIGAFGGYIGKTAGK